MLVRCSSIAPHTASMNPSSSRSNSAGSAGASRWYAAACGVRPRVCQRPRRRGRRRSGSKARSSASPSPSPRAPHRRQRGRGRRRGRCRAQPDRGARWGRCWSWPAGRPRSAARAPARSSTRTRGPRRCGSAFGAPGSCPGSSRAPPPLPTGSHPQAPPAATSGRAARRLTVSTAPGNPGTPEHRVGRLEVGHDPPTHLHQVGVQRRARRMAPGVGVGVPGHRQWHPHVR